MLDLLLSNKSQTRILFFLLVNSKCYASQLSQRLQIPLTPIQHSLRKLEHGGYLVSYLEGKNRYFEFNTSHILNNELIALLNKAYTHLPPEEKNLYYNPQFQFSRSSSKKNISGKSETLKLFWEKLITIQTLSFSAKSKSPSITAWNGLGKGHVDIKLPDNHILIYQERGSWISQREKTVEFTNTFRWTLNEQAGRISLEHLRFGPQNAVYLFDLSPVDKYVLESVDAHVCNEDTYFGRARYDGHFIQLHWRVIGPQKNEEIDYLYT